VARLGPLQSLPALDEHPIEKQSAGDEESNDSNACGSLDQEPDCRYEGYDACYESDDGGIHVGRMRLAGL
jgi:hypothetical protein